jgi:hypothetical protein
MSSLVHDSYRCRDGNLLVIEWQKGVGYVVGKLAPDPRDHRMSYWATRRIFNTKDKAEKAFVRRVRLDRIQEKRNNPPKCRRNPADPALAAAMRDATAILGHRPRMGRK